MREAGDTSYSKMAILQCKHKVTKKPICAVPCNGVQDLCEENLDEQCQGPGIVLTLVFVLLLSMSFILSSSGLSYHRLKKHKRVNIAGFELRPSGEHNIYDVKCLYLKLSVFKNAMDTTASIEVVINDYRKLTTLYCNDNDSHIMKLLGTNDISAYFYDCLDISLAVKVHVWLYSKVSILFTILRKIYYGAFIILMKGTVSLCLRYSDLSKDLLFLYMIWLQLGQYEAGSFPKAVFYILAASFLVTEISNMCVIFLAEFNGPRWWKLCVFILAPLMPAYYLYEIVHYELSKFIILNSFYDNSEISNIREYIRKPVFEIDRQIWLLQLKLAKLQYVENVLENIPQLTILLLISFLNQTSSRNVVNLQHIFMDDRVYIGWMLAAISVVSLIRGQVNYLVASKNGCQTGILLLIVYFLLGLSSR